MGIKENTINIRPGVGYLSILSAINYTPWHATAEFVDNSIQSYLDNKIKLKRLHSNYKLKIDIYVSGAVIEIKDNAGGINEENYERAFQAAMRPKKQTGLSEFGMGMKTAACWFSNLWTVKSKAIGEDFATEAKFDIEKITKDKSERLSYKKSSINKNSHFTIVTLKDLNHNPRGRSVERIKDHLASMYRAFIEKNEIEIRYNGSLLKYKSFPILKAPSYKDLDDDIINPKKRTWFKKFDFNFTINGKRHNIHGYAAIADPGNKNAGFAVFRRNRLLFGSDDEPWRPLKIIRQEGSSIARRLFGEIHFDDSMEVTHTKDNLNWSEDDKQAFLTKLKSVLDSDDMPIIRQADRFRKEIHTPEIRSTYEKAGSSSMVQLSKAMSVLEEVETKKILQIQKELPRPLSKPTKIKSKKINFQGEAWTIDVILNNDKDVENKKWLDFSFDKKGKKNKHIQIQIMMNKGFSSQYFGNDEKEIEGMISLLCYIVLAEIIGKQRGFLGTHMVREYINAIIDSVPPTIN
tara:strand:+ start:2094 stop:3650 length:1557 start_codon:yes stop_codon:yes gene_type:complete